MAKPTVDERLSTLKGKISQLLRKHPEAVEVLRLTTEYNELLSFVTDQAKAEARETKEPATVGPVTAKPVVEDTWPLDEVATILPESLFRSAVNIEYKLKPGKVGSTILRELSTDHPALESIRARAVIRVNTSGPKPLTIPDLEGLRDG